MAKVQRKPAIRVDGARRTNLADQRKRRIAAKERALPVEDDRVSQTWARHDAREASVKDAAAAAKRTAAAPPKIAAESTTIDNPDYSRDHAEGRLGNYRKIKATINVRESAIVTLHARGHIDTAQAKAAERFRALWEAMGGAGAKAMNYSKEPVDGGGSVDPISDRQVNAGIELAKCRELLGLRGYTLVSNVCGEGKALTDITAHKRERLTMADNLRANLDDLATMWGMQTNRRKAA